MKTIERLAIRFLEACRERRMMATTAESCTGGMIAAALTDIAGSSDVLDRSFVTYSNEAKMEMLGVSAATLAAHGAVSEETAREMAAGALSHSRAAIALSVTGIAGPGGATQGKPVGLVWFGAAVEGGTIRTERHVFENRGRRHIRLEALRTALRLGVETVEKR